MSDFEVLTDEEFEAKTPVKKEVKMTKAKLKKLEQLQKKQNLKDNIKSKLSKPIKKVKPEKNDKLQKKVKIIESDPDDDVINDTGYNVYEYDSTSDSEEEEYTVKKVNKKGMKSNELQNQIDELKNIISGLNKKEKKERKPRSKTVVQIVNPPRTSGRGRKPQNKMINNMKERMLLSF